MLLRGVDDVESCLEYTPHHGLSKQILRFYGFLGERKADEERAASNATGMKARTISSKFCNIHRKGPHESRSGTHF